MGDVCLFLMEDDMVAFCYAALLRFVLVLKEQEGQFGGWVFDKGMFVINIFAFIPFVDMTEIEKVKSL